MTGGRPIRFLSLVVVGWTAMRVLVLWQETGSLPEAIRRTFPELPGRLPSRTVDHDPPLIATLRARPVPAARAGAVTPLPVRADPTRVQLALLAATRFGAAYPLGGDGAPDAERPAPAIQLPPAAPLSLPLRPGTSRLTASAWLIARDGAARGSTLDGPQLGGTQAGVRVDYAIGRGFALTGRLAAPAAGIGREAAIGIAWQRAGVPIRVVIERRIALDDGRGGMAIGLNGGVSDRPLAQGFRLDGYAQAGAVLRGATDPYADAALRVARPIARIGEAVVDAGAGAWGGAQRSAARLDIGPTLGARVPVGGRVVRVSFDWRQRLAGNARPDSGPALSIGADF